MRRVYSEHALTMEHIRERGIQVLGERLGIVGMVRFLQQAETGWGNYTEERHQWLGDPDLRTVAKEIQQKNRLQCHSTNRFLHGRRRDQRRMENES